MDRKRIAQLLALLDPQLAKGIIAVVDQHGALEARCRLLEKTAEGWQAEATKISNREIAGRVALAEQVDVNKDLVARNRLLVDGIRAYRVREAKRTAARCPCTLIDLDEADAWEAEHGDLAGRAGHPGDSAATLRGHAAQEEDRDPSRPHRDD